MAETPMWWLVSAHMRRQERWERARWDDWHQQMCDNPRPDCDRHDEPDDDYEPEYDE